MLPIEKLKLESEIAKLQRERAFVPLTFAAQIFNSLCIVGVGTAVLIFFQMRQVDEQARMREESARDRLGQMILDVDKIKDAEGRKKAISVLEILYPDNRQVKLFVEAERTVASAQSEIATLSKPTTPTQPAQDALKEFCTNAPKTIAELQASISSMTEELALEIQGQLGRPPGHGPFAQALEVKLQGARTTMQTLTSRVGEKCKG
jgi:hypothetical protein